MTYIISRFIFAVLLKVLCKFKVKGQENLPDKGPFIMASNHVSYVDPPVIGVACRKRLAFMAKRELFESTFFGWWFKAMGCIPIERQSGSFRAIKAAIERLKRGHPIAIFPEGTRSVNVRLKKAEPGIGLIASKTGVPIIPVYISGTDKVLPKGKKFIRLHKVAASIGKRVVIGENPAFSEKRKFYLFIGEKIMEAISRLRDEQGKDNRFF